MATIRLVPEDDLGDKSTVAGSILAKLFEYKSTRTVSTVVTSQLVSNSEWTGVVRLGRSFRIIEIKTDKPCRVRLYATQAHQLADVSRPLGVDPSGDHGLIMEYVSTPGSLGAAISPVVQGSNLETVPVEDSAISVKNLSGALGTVQVEFTVFSVESENSIGGGTTPGDGEDDGDGDGEGDTGGGGTVVVSDSAVAALVDGPSQTREGIISLIETSTVFPDVDGAVSGLLSPSATSLSKTAVAAMITSMGADGLTREELDDILDEHNQPAGPPKTFYVSSVSGDDSFSGATAGQPLRTFDAAFNAVGTGKGVIILAPGETFPITKGYILDVNRHTLRGEKSRIDSTPAPAGIKVLTWMGSLMPPQFQSWNIFSGIELYCGPNPNGTSRRNQTGMYFDDDGRSASRGPSHVQLTGCIIRGYAVGVEIGDQTYCVAFDGFHIGHNTICYFVPSGIENSGERLSLTNGALFNSPTLVDMRHGTGELMMINVSLDAFTKQAITVDGSKVYMYACHVEFDCTNGEDPAFLVNGNSGSINMYGGSCKIRSLDTGKPPLMRTIIENNGAWRNGSVFRDVMMHNIDNVTSSRFSGGSGLTILENTQNYGGATRAVNSVGRAATLLADGSFSGSDFVDDWFISADALSRLPRRTTANNMKAEYSNSFTADTGGSLRLEKTAGTGSQAAISLAVPMRRWATPHALYSQKHPFPTGGGTVYVTAEAALMRYDDGRPQIIKREALLGQRTIDLSSAETVWQDTYFVANKRLPGWATHLLLTWNMTSTANGSVLFIDQIEITQS